MRQKKILFLGGAFSQVPAIKYAKEQGYYVITVDYLPKNPGHQISDEYHNISTVNKDEILELAFRLKIDAISAYASDPAALTAAYVNERLNLIGSLYKSVEELSNKNLFRDFLRKNNFNTPWYIYGSYLNEIEKNYCGRRAILKPVDSSGSKGIFEINNLIDLKTYFPVSKSYSRSGKVILEQFIKCKGPQIHGEGFVLDGEVIFLYLGDQVFSKCNRLAPYSTIVPSIFHNDIMNEVQKIIKLAIKKVGFQKGGINVEVIRDENDNIYILEIGARNGGNFMPQLMKHATGFDLVKANIETLFGNNLNMSFNDISTGYYAQIILHSLKGGVFHRVNIPAEFEDNILEQNIYYKPGDRINRYKDSKDVVGIIILRINNDDELKFYKKYLLLNEWVETSQIED